jgi:hypothetical protein
MVEAIRGGETRVFSCKNWALLPADKNGWQEQNQSCPDTNLREPFFGTSPILPQEVIIEDKLNCEQ